jgi:hypothetical protein
MVNWNKVRERRLMSGVILETKLRSCSVVDPPSPKAFLKMRSKLESEKPNQEVFTRAKISNRKRNRNITLPTIKFQKKEGKP